VTDTIRIWTRRDLEEAAAIEPEGRTMLRVLATPLFLLRMVEYAETRGDRIEMLSAYGDPNGCEIRFFRRDDG
jgi:hypothetical protein